MPPGRLTTLGNRLAVQTETGPVPLRLKGLNRSGLQHKAGLKQAGLADLQAELRAWRVDWGAQIIRLPLAMDFWLDSTTYQRDLDEVVAAAAQEGLYLMLELHGTSTHLSEPLPLPGSDAVWRDLARRYGAQPHVVFDLWNEPHSVPWAAWQTQATHLLRCIRDAGATDTLTVVGGIDWAYDLSPLLQPDNRIEGLGPVAYATHPYPCKGVPPHGPAQWEERFGRVARMLPVLLGEFGADASNERPYGLSDPVAADAWLCQLLAYVDGLELSALAWSAGDRPHLTYGRDGGPVSLPGSPPDPGRPTEPFGARVRAWMAGPRRAAKDQLLVA
ncbi:MAG: cellulase family glycosylhydrolase [Myxococcales bacterium]|nr:glycoside hydrolase family 5 protein [Myxococcota bacterium]MDW8281867.1 cellulase family glycosylhydrolase [Myxococcales bacterium]